MHQAKAKANKNNFEGLVAMLHASASMPLPTLLPFKAFESLAAAMQQERALGSRLLQVKCSACHVRIDRNTFVSTGLTGIHSCRQECKFRQECNCRTAIAFFCPQWTPAPAGGRRRRHVTCRLTKSSARFCPFHTRKMCSPLLLQARDSGGHMGVLCLCARFLSDHRPDSHRQFHVLPLHNTVYRARFSKKGETIIQDVIQVRHSHVYRCGCMRTPAQHRSRRCFTAVP